MPRLSLVLLAALLLSSQPALAWNGDGHRLVALIAHDAVPPELRRRVAKLLESHPRFEADLMPSRPAGPAGQGSAWLWAEASVWPDQARDLEGEERARYHHGSWHWLNFPLALHPQRQAALDLALAEPPGQIMDAYGELSQVLGDSARPAGERALAVSWLLHLIGDAHQPLHSTALFSDERFPKGDRGGNRLDLKRGGDLHDLWDDALGGGAPFPSLRQRARALAGHPAARGALPFTSMRSWLLESHGHAEALVYRPALLTVLRAAEQTPEAPLAPLSDDLLDLPTVTAAAELRVAEAGLRTARVLCQLLGPGA